MMEDCHGAHCPLSVPSLPGFKKEELFFSVGEKKNLGFKNLSNLTFSLFSPVVTSLLLSLG